MLIGCVSHLGHTHHAYTHTHVGPTISIRKFFEFLMLYPVLRLKLALLDSHDRNNIIWGGFIRSVIRKKWFSLKTFAISFTLCFVTKFRLFICFFSFESFFQFTFGFCKFKYALERICIVPKTFSIFDALMALMKRHGTYNNERA